jgi:hypothetical protein
MDSPRRQLPRARAAALACVLAAAVLLAVGGTARATDYGDGAPIPFLLLPADDPWNTPVDSLPLDPNSAEYIERMSPETGLHPDFGTTWEGARIGIPYIVVPGTQPKAAQVRPRRPAPQASRDPLVRAAALRTPLGRCTR